MVAKSSLPVDMSGAQSDSAAAVDHPVIRTLYDHLEEVTSLVFHPREQLLISGSKDYTVKVCMLFSIFQLLQTGWSSGF